MSDWPPTHILVGTQIVALNESNEVGLITGFRCDWSPTREEVPETTHRTPVYTWEGKKPDGSQWISTREPVVLGHLGMLHWEICEKCGRPTRAGICLNTRWICRTCGTPVPREAADSEWYCPVCERDTIVSRYGMVYPLTMMGLQAAAEDAWTGGTDGHG